MRPQIEEAIEAGLHIVSTCEELAYPELRHAPMAREIDRHAKAKGVAVMNTPGQNANAVAELAFAMMIYAARGKFDGKTGTELRGKTLGLHAFGMVGWKPDRAETIRLAKPHPGQGDESMLYLWTVPAEARGAWQSSDLKLRIHQNYQELEVEGTLGGRRALTGAFGVVSGYDVSWEAKGVRFRGRLEGARLVGDLLIDGRSESVVLTRAR